MLFHPFIISPLGGVILLVLSGESLAGALGWSGLCAAIVIGPALVYLKDKLKKKEFTDADVSVREHRFGFYVFGATCMILCFVVLILFRAPSVLIAGATTALCALVIAIVINRFWDKLSIHVGCTVGVAAACSLYSVPWALFFGFGAAAVAWARWVNQRHTVRQMIIGAVVALISIFGIFAPIVGSY